MQQLQLNLVPEVLTACPTPTVIETPSINRTATPLLFDSKTIYHALVKKQTDLRLHIVSYNDDNARHSYMERVMTAEPSQNTIGMTVYADPDNDFTNYNQEQVAALEEFRAHMMNQSEWLSVLTRMVTNQDGEFTNQTRHLIVSTYLTKEQLPDHLVQMTGLRGLDAEYLRQLFNEMIARADVTEVTHGNVTELAYTNVTKIDRTEYPHVRKEVV